MSSPKPKVLITLKLPDAIGDQLKEKYDLSPSWPHDSFIPRDELLKRIVGVDGLLWASPGKVDKDVIVRAGPSLKVISSVSVGYDHIDMAEARSRGIRVGNTPGVLTDACADLAIGLLLAAARRMFEANKQVINDQWQGNLWSPLWMCGIQISGRTVGIVGFGGIGQAVAKRLIGFDVGRLLYCGHTPKKEAISLKAEFVSFDTLLKESDFIIASCSLTQETQGLFSKEAFRKMKSSAIFVNVGRGGLVDQDALADALQTGKIQAAGLDVMTPEPIPPDHILTKLDNCILLPHIGSTTLTSRFAMMNLAVRNLDAALSGKPMPAEVK